MQTQQNDEENKKCKPTNLSLAAAILIVYFLIATIPRSVFVAWNISGFLKRHVVSPFTGTGTSNIPVLVNQNRGILTSLMWAV